MEWVRNFDWSFFNLNEEGVWMWIKTFRVRNYKPLADSGEIELSPKMNIVVGRTMPGRVLSERQNPINPLLAESDGDSLPL